ncbi:MAG TPA: CHAT domain-containing tetratricopeptide repeat protein [Thermoanaerobaculia bacterium]
MPPQELINIQTLLLDTCVDALDVECLALHLPIFDASVSTWSGSFQDLAQGAIYWSIFKQQIGDRSEPSPEAILARIANKVTPLPPDLYIEVQIRHADALLLAGNYEGSRLATERALSLLVTLRKPIPYYAARWLARICYLFVRQGDVARALKLFRVSLPLWLRALPPGSAATGEVLELAGRLAERIGEFRNARQYLELLRTQQESQELPERIHESFRDWALTELAGTCIVMGDLPCARSALEQSSYAIKLQAPPRRRLTESETAYVAALLLVDTLQARPIHAEWLTPLEDPRLANDPDEKKMTRLARESLLAGAAGLIRYVRKEPGADRNIVEFIKKRLEIDAIEAAAHPDATTLPSAMDRVYIRFGLEALARIDGFDRTLLADMTIRVSQATNRTLRDADGDALALVANSRDEYARRNAHALMRLTARQTDEERIWLAALVASLTGSGEALGDKSFAIYDFTQRTRLGNLSEQRAVLRSQVKRETRPAVPHYITLTDLQSVLAPDEVVVCLFEYLGSIVHVAVSKTDTQLAATLVDREKFAFDFRVLKLALTADGPPSDERDAEYPAERAFRLYELLLKPVEAILTGKRHIVWIPPADLAGLPIGALVRAAPPSSGGERELEALEFVAQALDVSYAPSLKAFVSARKAPLEFRGQRTFFGAGDPTLSGETDNGVSRSEAVLRGGLRLGLASLVHLDELPDTGAELREVASKYGNRATVLTGDAATEASVRRHLLRDYDVVEFATHGLLGNELRGLSESALVLTPTSPDDQEDDGLLRASEIADFDLRADLAVLSACNTGQVDAELVSPEVHGLTNALALAGVPASLVTLWPVDSVLARHLVGGALATMRERGLRPAEALGDAVRAHLSSPTRSAYRNPRFWAPFVIYGDGRRPEVPSSQARVGWTRKTYEIQESRGEGTVLSLAALADGGILSSAIHWNADAAVGALERSDASGKSLWRRETSDWTPLRIATSSEGIAVLGLEGKRGVTQPTLVLFGTDGRELWRRGIDVASRECLPLAVSHEADGWHALVSLGGPDLGAVGKRSVLVVSWAEDGNITQRDEAEIDEGVGALNGSAVRQAGTWMVAIQGWKRNESLSPVPTGYGETDPCQIVAKTTLAAVPDSTPRWTALRHWDDAQNAGAIVVDGSRLILAGSSVDRCGRAQIASVKFADPAANAWSGDGVAEPLPSHIVRVLKRGRDGSLLAVTASERLGDPGDGKLHDRHRPIPGRPQEQVIPGRRWEDVVVQRLEPKGGVVPELWFGAGTSITLEDAILSGDVLTVGGMIGGKSFLATFEWAPQP